MLLFTAAWAGQQLPPLELVGLEKTPRATRVCELALEDHESEVHYTFRLIVGAPDAQARSWVQRVTLGTPSMGVPADSPVLVVHEVDVHNNFVDDRIPDRDGRTHVTFVKPRAVDWSRWPLTLEFIGPRVDNPWALGAYKLSVREGATPQDWSGCILQLERPGGLSSCVMLNEVSGSCLSDYLRRLAPEPKKSP
jgi:hypothetical protein